jgi:hypothetical protein
MTQNDDKIRKFVRLLSPALYFSTVVDELAAGGVVLTARSGHDDYCVNLRNGTAATEYITDDLDDAIEHGNKLARSLAPAPEPSHRRV